MRRIIVGLAAAVASLMALAGPAAAATGAQRLVIVFSGPQGSPGRIVLSGPLSGVGTSVDTETSGTITLRGGTIDVEHPITSNNDSFNPVTCKLKIDESGPYQLVGGTGQYAGVSGAGSYSTKGTVVFRKTAQGCSDQPIASVVVVRGSGSTTLPG